jgi:hypothetical protein
VQVVEQPIMIDPVERRCQVRVKDPRPRGAFALADREDGLDRVMTSPAGPEAVASRLESGLPLRLQCVEHHGLCGTVGDHRDAERTPLAVRLRDVDPADREGRRPVATLLDPPGKFCPIWCGQRGQAVDPSGSPPLVDLRDPSRRDQRVRPGPQHQPLQAPHLAVVARP